MHVWKRWVHPSSYSAPAIWLFFLLLHINIWILCFPQWKRELVCTVFDSVHSLTHTVKHPHTLWPTGILKPVQTWLQIQLIPTIRSRKKTQARQTVLLKYNPPCLNASHRLKALAAWNTLKKNYRKWMKCSSLHDAEFEMQAKVTTWCICLSNIIFTDLNKR